MSEIKHDVFISYARRDGLTFAERLDIELARMGMRVWRDKRSLDPTQDFTSELEKAIEQTQQVAVCLTPDTKRNESFVRREISYALALKKPIVPLLFADLVPPINIVNLTHIDFFRQGWEAALNELLTRLQKGDYQPPGQPQDPFRDYLNALYQNIVNYLDKTVFSLITLNTEDTPAAVNVPQEVPTSALPMAFFDMLPNNDEPQAASSYSDFHTAFNHYHGRVLLLGEPGGGKTTTLMAFARDAVAKRLEDPKQPLPLVAPIATWDSQKAPSLADWLSGQIRALKHEDIAQTIQQGNALLLLDGLDELGSEREDDETKERFDPRLRFIQRLPSHNQILMTCRIKDYDDIAQKVPLNGAVTLQPLNDEQMRVYLAKQPDLLAAIEADSGLREMARTPLILSLFTFAYSGLGEEAVKLRDLVRSPHDMRDQILASYVRRRYEREARRPNVQIMFTLDRVYEVLGWLAVENYRNKFAMENSFAISEFEQILDKHAVAFVELIQQLHLMFASDSQNFRFVHLLVRDHFAFPYLLALLNQPKPVLRSIAARILGQMQDTRSLESLILCLRDTNPDVRRSAVWALGQMEDSRPVEHLIAALSDSSSMVRSAAAIALRRSGSSRAVEELVKIVSDSNIWVRRSAITALRDIGDSRAVELLLDSSANKTVQGRINIVEALEKIGDNFAVDALIGFLSDIDEAVRVKVIETLAKIGNPQVIDSLKMILNDSSSRVRAKAVETLGRVGGNSVAEILISMLSDESGQVRQKAAESLGLIESEVAVQPLIKILSDPNPETRTWGAWALGRIGDARSVDSLLPLLMDSDSVMRSWVVWALGRIADKRAVNAVLPLLQDREKGLFGKLICDVTAEALTSIGTPEALAAVEAWRRSQSSIPPTDTP